jgi:Rieske Fe-S protein
VTRPPVTRRRALAGAAGTGLALPVLAACGSDDGGPSSSAPDTTSPSTTAGSTSAAPSESAEPSESASEPAAAGVVSTADVPVGSGVIIAADQVVVTQPTEGDVHVFTTTCTHSGCAVTQISADGIVCPCHGSVFDLTTGDVLGGPAPSPLPTVDFEVDGDQVVLS